MNKYHVIMLIFLALGIRAAAQEKGVKIISSDEKCITYGFFLSELDQRSDAEIISSAFMQKEGVIRCTPDYRDGRVFVKASKQIKASDIRDVIAQTGYQIIENKDKLKQMN